MCTLLYSSTSFKHSVLPGSTFTYFPLQIFFRDCKKKERHLNYTVGTRNKRKLHASYLVELIRDQCHFTSKWNTAVKVNFGSCYRVTENITLLLVSIPRTKKNYQFFNALAYVIKEATKYRRT